MGLAGAGLAVLLLAGINSAASPSQSKQHTHGEGLDQKIIDTLEIVLSRLDVLEKRMEQDLQAHAATKLKAAQDELAVKVKAEEQAVVAVAKATGNDVEVKKKVEEEAAAAVVKAAASAETAVLEAVELASQLGIQAAKQEAEMEAAQREDAIKSGNEAIIATAKNINRAFLFVKPHANTEAVNKMVRESLEGQGFIIKAEGELSAQEIDAKRLIDTHYGAIASKAVVLKPSELNVPEKGKEQFKQAFGISWQEALDKGLVKNAKEACEVLQVDGDELEALWRKIDKKDLIKFGGGFYCGKIKDDLFGINGFYMQMRGRYTSPPASIHFYEVEWAPASLPWNQFREGVLGATDPSKAAEGSLRRKVYESWESLGLKKCPDTGDNSMHGSASPFEALAEVANWEGKKIEEDLFGQALLLSTGLDIDTIKLWLGDAQVPVNGKLASIFDTLEDQNSKDNIEALVEITKKLPVKIVA